MKKMVFFLFSLFSFLLAHPLLKAEESIAKVNGIQLWCETFGEKTNPALLLIMGSGAQGILWPTAFCEKLASEGLYVIRFDHRDTGYSSSIDYTKQPYSLMDMAKDCVGLFDHLKIKKGHIVGTSLGGGIAQLMGAYFPDRLKSITLLASTKDFTNIIDTWEGNPRQPSELSYPADYYVKWLESLKGQTSLSTEELLANNLEGYELCNGPDAPFEKEFYKDLILQSLQRQKDPDHHMLALKASLNQIKESVSGIKVPTLVIQGSKDPIFPEDHGEVLADSINEAKFLLIEGMGHCLNSAFYEVLIRNIKAHIAGVESPTTFDYRSGE